MENETHRGYMYFLNTQRDKAARYFLPFLVGMNLLALGIIAVVKL